MRLKHALALILLASSTVLAQTTGRIDLVAAGDVRPEVKSSQDLGPVDATMFLKHLVLKLKPPADAQLAMENRVRALSNPASPSFHHWLSPSDVSAQLALPDDAMASIENWIGSQGLRVDGVAPSHAVLYVSGSVQQVEKAFHTSIHRFRSPNGEVHMANVTRPLLPASLSNYVSGIVALHDYPPHRDSTPFQIVSPETLLTSGNQYVGASDLQVIYHISDVHNLGISGQGQTIAVLETSDMYSSSDWLAYRRGFGLTKRFPQGQLVAMHPGSSNAANRCIPPGIQTADREATLDAEVVTAAAPNATVVVASCANTFGDTGLNIALANLLTTPNPPQVISISYGNSETVMSQAARDEVNSLYMLAAADGISIFVSSGDGGADGYYSDRGTPGTHGISSSGLASTEWNVAVGGTDFEDTYLNEVSTYWSPFNSATRQSALSYVPEIPWNNSCGSDLIASYYGYASTAGSGGLCNSLSLPTNISTGLTGSGGPSTCATGTPSIPGVTSGSCAGRPKPAWQYGLLGVPNDGARDLPDVSLFASGGGVWNHGYLMCFSDPSRSGTDCATFYGVSGGTSASSPLMAGIQLLINQGTGQSWGNPDPVYYALARNEYGSAGNAGCDASLANAASSDCIFHDITQGNNAVSCSAGTPNCYAPSGSVGVLSVSTNAYQPAYGAATGWDFSTGIGSVNAVNLLNHWSESVAALATSLSTNN